MGYPYSGFTSCQMIIYRKIALSPGSSPVSCSVFDNCHVSFISFHLELVSQSLFLMILALFFKIYTFLAVLGLHCWWAFSSCSEWGASLAVVHRLLSWLSTDSRRTGFRSRGTQAQLPRGIKPMSPELAGGFLTTGPSGKPDTGTFQSMWASYFSE